MRQMLSGAGASDAHVRSHVAPDISSLASRMPFGLDQSREASKDAPVEGWIMPGLRRGPGLGGDSDRSAFNRDNYFRSRFGRTISFTDVSGPADTRYGSRRGHAGSGEAGRSCQYWMTMITVCGRSRIRSD
jgi:hypothetical protein